MKKNKLYILLSIFIIIMIFGTAASCNFCGIPIKVGEVEEDKTEVSIKDTGEVISEEKEETGEEVKEENITEEDSELQVEESEEENDEEVLEEETVEEAIPKTTTVQTKLYPSDVGHIIQHAASPNVVNTVNVIIGDSSSNTDIRGFFAFDVSSLSGTQIITASLILNTYILYDDPTFKDYIGLRWGTYLPLDPNDYLMLGTHPVESYDNNQEPIVFSRGDLVVAIGNMANINNDKLQFTIGYSNDSSDGDGIVDGREYRIEDIILLIEYIP